jgi:broad specificity phosphatase PhoE
VNHAVLVRHGETEWSASGRHTSHTDVPLTERGRTQATALGSRLSGRRFARVLTSPMRRARDTCALAGFASLAVVDGDLHEWDYGVYEGRTLAEVRDEVPSWSVWDGPTPGGESAADVGARANRVIATLHEIDGDVLMFGHGHFLRALGARFVGLAADDGRRFRLDTATLSTLGYERGTPVFLSWNAR